HYAAGAGHVPTTCRSRRQPTAPSGHRRHPPLDAHSFSSRYIRTDHPCLPPAATTRPTCPVPHDAPGEPCGSRDDRAGPSPSTTPSSMPPTFHSPSGTRTLRIALPILTVVAFILVTSLVDGGKGVVPSALWHAPDWAPWWHAPLRLFCNALPGLMVGGIVLALTRRLGLAAVVALALEVPVCVVNARKRCTLGSPLLPAC